MELLALVALSLMSIVGWVLATECLGRWIDRRSRFYFAPGLGMAACAITAYVAAGTRQTWLIPFFVLVALVAFFWSLLKQRLRASLDDEGRRLLSLTLLTFFCLYGMQLSLLYLFKGIYPGPHEVWGIFNLSGVPPPDQMFAWHQAMFVDLHRHYPEDPFLADMDLYDRTQLGGYLTLFFFKLFHLPLLEDHFVYPARALRFYHCFWWGLNNLYLLAIAPLFQRLLGYRAALLAVAATALSAFILLSNIGGWVKFAALYPLLLAAVLFLDARGPFLQAGLCATSYYLHGSALPFLLGFGLFQILCLYYPIRPSLARLRDVAWFAATGLILVGSWFVVVKFVGSKQPLFYFYIYDAGLTEAQTQPVAQIAKAFYAKHSWSSLSLLPVHNLINSLYPIHLHTFLKDLFSSRISWAIADLASMSFQCQRFFIFGALGLAALPFVLLGVMKTLSRQYAGRTFLTLYLIPSLLIALVYRINWSFSLHVICVYHTFILFFWVSILRHTRQLVVSALAALTLEGVLCCLVAEVRLLPVHGLQLNQLTARSCLYLVSYLSFVLVILGATYLQLRALPSEVEVATLDRPGTAVGVAWVTASRKLFVGVLITALTIASYSVYCLQFY
jgi:hypothetical protein